MAILPTVALDNAIMSASLVTTLVDDKVTGGNWLEGISPEASKLATPFTAPFWAVLNLRLIRLDKLVVSNVLAANCVGVTYIVLSAIDNFVGDKEDFHLDQQGYELYNQIGDDAFFENKKYASFDFQYYRTLKKGLFEI